MLPLSFYICRIATVITLVAGLAGCGYGFYSPLRDTEAVVGRERAATGKERQAHSIEGTNATLRAQEKRLESQLTKVRLEIQELQSQPGAPDTTMENLRLQKLHEEERRLRLNLREVNDQIDREVDQQNQLRREEL